MFSSEFQRVICDTLEELRFQNNAILLNQAKILSYVAPEDELYDVTNMPPLFITNEDKFNKFEEFLNSSTNFRSYVIFL